MEAIAHKVSTGLEKVPKLARQFYSSVVSSFSSRNGEMTPPPSTSFPQPSGVRKMSDWKSNPRDKALLRETWSSDFEVLWNLGGNIYLHIFNHNPACKSLFPWIVKYEAEGRDFTEGKEFRTQSLRFVQTISTVIKNVYHVERLQGFLYTVGHNHVKFQNRGFQAAMWDLFEDAMQAALTNRMNSLPQLTDEDRERAIEIWRDIALFIIVHMKEGYNDGLKGINRFPTGAII